MSEFSKGWKVVRFKNTEAIEGQIQYKNIKSQGLWCIERSDWIPTEVNNQEVFWDSISVKYELIYIDSGKVIPG